MRIIFWSVIYLDFQVIRWLRFEVRMTVLKAHFDGRVLVPDEPVDLPVNCALELHVQPLRKSTTARSEGKSLMKLVELLEELPDNPDAPNDGAAQHDYYLYGLPKRP